MFTLTKDFTFEAAHKLPLHDGKCSRLHGHSWKCTVVVRGQELATKGPKTGMLHDFGDIKYAFQPLLEQFLDHHYLNETTGLQNPTSEELARWIYQKLQDFGCVGLVAVEIRETCTCSARYELPS